MDLQTTKTQVLASYNRAMQPINEKIEETIKKYREQLESSDFLPIFFEHHLPEKYMRKSIYIPYKHPRTDDSNPDSAFLPGVLPEVQKQFEKRYEESWYQATEISKVHYRKSAGSGGTYEYVVDLQIKNDQEKIGRALAGIKKSVKEIVEGTSDKCLKRATWGEGSGNIDIVKMKSLEEMYLFIVKNIG